MTAVVLGLVVSPICFFFVTTVKNVFKYDDSLDVFGVHCIGGIVGALGTAIVADPKLGGQGYFDYTKFPGVAVAPADYSIASQLMVQLEAILTTLIWSGGVSLVLFLILKYTIGIRPSVEVEQGRPRHQRARRTGLQLLTSSGAAPHLSDGAASNEVPPADDLGRRESVGPFLVPGPAKTYG